MRTAILPFTPRRVHPASRSATTRATVARVIALVPVLGQVNPRSLPAVERVMRDLVELGTPHDDGGTEVDGRLARKARQAKARLDRAHVQEIAWLRRCHMFGTAEILEARWKERACR
jgi:hypothetical protein